MISHFGWPISVGGMRMRRVHPYSNRPESSILREIAHKTSPDNRASSCTCRCAEQYRPEHAKEVPHMRRGPCRTP